MMSIEDFTNTITADEVATLRAICAKRDADLTDNDVETFYAYMTRASMELGEDLVAEPLNYLAVARGGLRSRDLVALIHDGFDAEQFAAFNNALGFQLFAETKLGEREEQDTLYTFASQRLRQHRLRQLLDGHSIGDTDSSSTYRECAADVAFYMYGSLPEGDILRDSQTLFLLLAAGEASTALSHFSASNDGALQQAVVTLGQIFGHHADAELEEIAWSMLAVDATDVDYTKVFSLMVNDVVGIINNAKNVLPYVERLHDVILSHLAQHGEIATLLGIDKLRIAQSYRLLKDESKAQSNFIAALNYLMPSLEKAELQSLSPVKLDQYWIALKICQEMAQAKAMNVMFKVLTDIERRIIAEAPDRRAELTERLLVQYVDIAKTRHAMPKQLQEQLEDRNEEAITLLRDYLSSDVESAGDIDHSLKRAAYYQNIGELCLWAGRDDESYDALTEAQILQLRTLGELQRRDGEGIISPDQLGVRLTLSVTNHMLAQHHRKNPRGKHDLGVLLQNNIDIAYDCLNAYPNDRRVLHLIVNAALELGDFKHKEGGLYAESQTYDSVLSRLMPILNNMQIDQQLAVDIAMLHTKAGQVLADDSMRRYKEALRNLDIAQKLWKALGDNTNNLDFKKNAEAVSMMIKNLQQQS